MESLNEDDGDTIVEDSTPSNTSGGDTINITGDGNTVNTGGVPEDGIYAY